MRARGGAGIVAAMRLSANRNRFVAKLDVGDCWTFTGALNNDGYGRFALYVEGVKRVLYAHRVGYAMMTQELDDDLDLDHRCKNRACVNPDHLEPVVREINTARGESFSARRMRATRCEKRGHEFTSENTIWERNANGRRRRRCRACRDISRGRIAA